MPMLRLIGIACLLLAASAGQAQPISVIAQWAQSLGWKVERLRADGLVVRNPENNRVIGIQHRQKRFGDQMVHFFMFRSFYRLTPYAKRHPDRLFGFLNRMARKNASLAYIDADGDLSLEHLNVGRLSDRLSFAAAFSVLDADMDTFEQDSEFSLFLYRPQDEAPAQGTSLRAL